MYKLSITFRTPDTTTGGTLSPWISTIEKTAQDVDELGDMLDSLAKDQQNVVAAMDGLNIQIQVNKVVPPT